MEKRPIKVSEVLALLEQGNDRTAIRTQLDLTHAEMASLFKHPKLKNKKPKTQATFVLVDDTADEVESVVNKVTSEVTEEINELVAQVVEPTVEVTAELETAPEPVVDEEAQVTQGAW